MGAGSTSLQGLPGEGGSGKVGGRGKSSGGHSRCIYRQDLGHPPHSGYCEGLQPALFPVRPPKWRFPGAAQVHSLVLATFPEGAPRGGDHVALWKV